MTSLLDFCVDGTKVSEQDLQSFKSEVALQNWIKRVEGTFDVITRGFSSNPDGPGLSKIEFLDQLDTFVKPRLDELEAEKTRNLQTKPDRNLDLIVSIRSAASQYSPSFNRVPVSVVAGLLEMFDSAVDMTRYEFDAYVTVGDEELNNQGINTIYDLFGYEFASKFYRRKEHLQAKVILKDLYIKRRQLAAEIDKWEEKL